MVKRINVNVPDECHHLLKNTCTQMGVTVNEFAHQATSMAIYKAALENDHLKQIILAMKFEECGKAYRLQVALRDGTPFDG